MQIGSQRCKTFRRHAAYPGTCRVGGFAILCGLRVWGVLGGGWLVGWGVYGVGVLTPLIMRDTASRGQSFARACSALIHRSYVCGRQTGHGCVAVSVSFHPRKHSRWSHGHCGCRQCASWSVMVSPCVLGRRSVPAVVRPASCCGQFWIYFPYLFGVVVWSRPLLFPPSWRSIDGPALTTPVGAYLGTRRSRVGGGLLDGHGFLQFAYQVRRLAFREVFRACNGLHPVQFE